MLKITVSIFPSVWGGTDHFFNVPSECSVRPGGGNLECTQDSALQTQGYLWVWGQGLGSSVLWGPYLLLCLPPKESSPGVRLSPHGWAS